MQNVDVVEPNDNSSHTGMKLNLYVHGKVAEHCSMVTFDFKMGNISKMKNLAKSN